jgi:hypothetical protein
MSIYDKSIKNVADAAYKIMAEKLHPNQQKLDVHEPEKDKLTADDFKKLRSMKKEEAEQVAEAKFDPLKHVKNPSPAVKSAAKDVKRSSYADRAALMKAGGVKDDRGPRGVTQEEVEQVDEAESPFTSYKKPRPIESKGSRYGGSAQKSKPEHETDEEKPKKKKLSEMVNEYKHMGLKSLAKMAKPIKEEPDNEQFTKELEDQKASMEGKKKQPAVAAPATQGVKIMPEEIEQIDEVSTKLLAKAASSASDPMKHYDDDEKYHDPQKFADHAKKTKDAKSAAAVQGAADAKGHYPRPGHSVGVYDKLAYRTPSRVTAAGKANKQDVKTLKNRLKEEESIDDINGVKIVNIEERSLTEPEMKKKEDIVKGMKKNLSGFKERYGKDAKSVMYATATKNAKGE